MAEQELNLESLASRMEQVEQNLNIVKDNSIDIKEKLYSLNQIFANRPELEILRALQAEIASLQKQLKQLANLSDRTDKTETTYTFTTSNKTGRSNLHLHNSCKA